MDQCLGFQQYLVKENELHAEMDQFQGQDKAEPPPDFRVFSGGGVTPIDIFKTTCSIATKFFWGQLQQICSSEKFFRPRRIFYAPRIFYEAQLFGKIAYFGLF